MAAPRKRTQAPADPPADATPEVQDPAPLTPPDEEPAAPLTPPDDGPSTDAAPLTPPVRREPAPEVKEDALTPPPPPAALGQEPTLDLRWEDGTVASPDELFEDPGPQFTYLVVARRVLERHYFSGATTPSDRLLYPVGARVARSEADRIRREMASSRG
ncbi:hypothetical protein [Nonomuraea dietziae]|uniref:hypothetical protein n=1 Tax=Nonomuraea dietziae TaxID=65515 RepID=UPI0033DBD606